MKSVKLMSVICILLSLSFVISFSQPVFAASGLRKNWKTGKKVAQKKISKICKSEGKKDKALCSLPDFKGDLGPNLDKFDKALKKFEKKKDSKSEEVIKKQYAKIIVALKKYRKAVKIKTKEWKKAGLAHKHWSTHLLHDLNWLESETEQDMKDSGIFKD
jgi:hypothetical protein